MTESKVCDLHTLTDFMSLTRLSEREVLRMLENGELDFTQGASGDLLIDISAVSVETIAQRGLKHGSPTLPVVNAVTEEMVASELVSGLEEIIDEALEIALHWLENK